MMTLSTTSAPEGLSPACKDGDGEETLTLFEFLGHNHLRGSCDVVSRTHGWVSRCYNRHAVRAVGRIQLHIG